MNIYSDKNLLKTPSDPVSFAEGLKIGQDLLNTLERYPDGMGLAAVQVGVFKNVFVVDIPRLRTQIFINPRITYRDHPMVSVESCLSLPNIKCRVPRYNYIEIESDSEPTGIRTKWGFWSQEAIVCQHEYDHLLGITIEDIEVPDYIKGFPKGA